MRRNNSVIGDGKNKSEYLYEFDANKTKYLWVFLNIRISILEINVA